MSELHKVAVCDDTLEAIRSDDGTVWVVVRRVCEALGIDVATQRGRLQVLPWAQGKVRSIQSIDALGRPRQSVAIELDALPMWLVGIDAGRVSSTAQTKLIRFQVEARSALAAHFVGWAMPTQPSGGIPVQTGRPSGGSLGPGGPKSGALEMVSALEGMLAVVRANAERIEEVDARVTVAETRAAAAEVRADEAAAVAAHAVANSTMAREDRRRCDAAVKTITRTCQNFCASTCTDYRVLYGKFRRALGLRRSTEGGPALGRAKLSASAVLVLARAATNEGVPGLGAARIAAILNGEDDPTRPGFIDVDTKAIQ